MLGRKTSSSWVMPSKIAAAIDVVVAATAMITNVTTTCKVSQYKFFVE